MKCTQKKYELEPQGKIIIDQLISFSTIIKHSQVMQAIKGSSVVCDSKNAMG